MHELIVEVIRSVLILAAFFGILYAIHATQPVLERAAYLEGRYGLDPRTALNYAMEGK